MPEKLWPPPGFPLVEGNYALTETWSIRLPEPFARRIEDGSLVLWRQGLTIWLSVWGNDNNESQSERLEWIKREASPDRYSEKESISDGLTRYSYRLRDENDDGPLEALYGFAISDDGHLQLSVYFDDVADEISANQLVGSVFIRDSVD